MASNTARSAFVAILCMAVVLCIQAEDECDCVCGVSRNNRIVGGSRAGKMEFPWLIAIMKRGSYHCGGSLISDRHVLTAAHCFNGVRQTDLTITLGAYDIKDKSENVLKRSIKTVTKHPDFNVAVRKDSDIAIVELDQRVTFGEGNIGTACLPSETFREYDGEHATVVGRGVMENGLISRIPMKVNVPLMTIEACRGTDYKSNEISDNMLCAGFPEGGKDACEGDSGGPLNLRMTNTTMSNMELIGVVSWGKGCATPNQPGVYTRVQQFVSWIRSQIAGACECARV